MAHDSREPWYEAAFGAHYPLLYGHRNEAEAASCLKLLPDLAPLTSGPGDLVLDLGCGDGRHLRQLAGSGVGAVGLDLSWHLLQAAASAAATGPTRLVRGDMRRLPFGATAFSAVLSLFTAFGYFGGPAANGGPVQEVARVLRTGGHWFLDYFDGDRVRAELGDGKPNRRERRLGCLAVRETRQYLAATAQVVKDVELAAVPGHEEEALAVGVGPGGVAYQEAVAVFTLPELDGLAARGGLRRVAQAGDYEGGRLGVGTRWILVYQKEHTTGC